ncbi:MAG: cysteine--tRNA ligase [Halanaerobiales bacterium]
MLEVYNTLTGKREKFEPINQGKVNMYVCGLTVQNYSHIGHIRSAINYDVIRRYLEYKGYKVNYIQNFTDINEKIVRRAEREEMEPMALAEKYANAYLEDSTDLNIKPADNYCRVSENITEIIRVIETLIDKGYAYEVEGSVYFSVEKFDDYGKLSGRSLEDMEAGARVKVEENKKHPMDFALWKKVEEEDVIRWDSPWGKGWPGWHIECSVMSMKELDEQIDIHGGGTDLIFPHHENEIAQSESYSGKKPFAKYWLHNGTVNLEGEKMSKSLGNYYTTRELLKEFTADELRYFLLTKHYRSPIDFSYEEVKKARVSLNKLLNSKKSLRNLLTKEPQGKDNFTQEDFIDKIKKRRQEFEAAMDNDFNTAQAIGVLNELSTDINGFINKNDFKLTNTTRTLIGEANKLFEKLSTILGLKLESTSSEASKSSRFNDLVEYILKLREEAREKENWEKADQIRDDLKDMGIKVKDTPHGYEWEVIEGNNDES